MNQVGCLIRCHGQGIEKKEEGNKRKDESEETREEGRKRTEELWTPILKKKDDAGSKIIENRMLSMSLIPAIAKSNMHYINLGI